MRVISPRQLSVAASLTVSAGLVLALVPAAASAIPAPRDVISSETHVQVTIADEEGEAPLAGVQLKAHAMDSDEAIGTAVTGSDGTATMQIEAPEGLYFIDADWPGAPSDLESGAEFFHGRDTPVHMNFWAPFTTVTGTVHALLDGEPLASLKGASLVIASGEVEVQRINLGSNGSFTSGALPTTTDANYTVTLVPPSPYTLAAEQPDSAPFALPAATGTGEPGLNLNPTFALDAPPEREPEPQPEPEPEPQEPWVPPIPTAPSRISVHSGPQGGLHFAIRSGPESQLLDLIDPRRGQAPAFVQSGDLGRIDGLVFQTQSALPAEFPRGFEFDPQGYAIISTQELINRVLQQRHEAEEVNRKMAEAMKQHALQVAGLEALRDYERDRSHTNQQRLAENLRQLGYSSDDFENSPGSPSPDRLKSIAAEVRGDLASPQRANELDQAASQLKKQELINELKRSAKDEPLTMHATMFSEPVSLGSVTITNDVVTGSFDYSKVPAGEHHLVLSIDELGLSYIVRVTVHPDELAATGSAAAAPLWGLALVALGGAVLVFARVSARRMR